MHTLSLVALLAGAVFFDIRQRRIPNELVLVGSMLALALSLLPAGIGLLPCLKGLGLGLVLLLPMYLLRMMGAGDVKLLAMVGAFVGSGQIVQVWLLTLVSGGVLALAFALRYRMLSAVLRNTGWIAFAGLTRLGREAAPTLESSHGNKVRLPYALAIAAGTLLTLAQPFF